MEINKALNNLVICHMQKSAGVAFMHNLYEIGLNKNSLYYDKEDHRNLYLHRFRGDNINIVYPENYNQHKIICGHFHASKYMHTNRDMITWVRDPVERAISHYFYYKMDKAYPNILDYAKDFHNYETYILDCDLSRFKFIGIAERLDDSLKRFLVEFNIDTNKDLLKLTPKKTNINIGKPEINIEIKEEMKQFFKDDYALYERIIYEIYG